MAGFEQAPFGDGSASGSGNVTTAVNTHFGERESSQGQGNIRTAGVMTELSIEILGSDASAGNLPLLNPEIPAGAMIEDVYVKVSEAFTLGGTTPTVLFGTQGSEVTNGFVISEAQAEATGSYDVTGTLTGTWAAPLAADTVVDVALGGTTPTSADSGKLEVVIRYAKV